jgi:hypothetical protein
MIGCSKQLRRNKMMGARICIAMAAINVPFIVEDPSRWWNWCAAVFCLGIGIVVAIINGRQ